MTNLEHLIKEGLILESHLPSQADIDTINHLHERDVEGLIKVFKAVGSPFLVRNCNPGGTVAAKPGARIIGIVF
jgi:hypothetical protein